MKNYLWLILLLFPVSSQAQLSDFEFINFDKADSIAEYFENYPLSDPKVLSEKLTTNLKSDVEKFRAIFKWVCNNLSYDVEMYHVKGNRENKLRYNRKALIRWQKRFSHKLNKRVFTKKIALCSGYSLLIETLCKHAGLQCTTIDGYGKLSQSKIGKEKINHAWNAVNLNNKWYLADATWASGGVNEIKKKFIRRYNNDYFLTEPYYFASNHYPKDPSWLLFFEKPSLKNFQNAPIRLDGFIRLKINQFYPEKGYIKIKKDSIFSLEFTSNANKKPKVAAIEVYGYKYVEDQNYNLSESKEGMLLFKHKFTRKGMYRVWIYIERWPAFIYDVYVY